MRSTTKNLSDYDGKYMKIRFNTDGELPLNKIPLKKSLPYKQLLMFFVLKKVNIIHKFSQMNICVKYKKMESKYQLKETDIKNCACYFFYDIINGTDINFNDILLD